VPGEGDQPQPVDGTAGPSEDSDGFNPEPYPFGDVVDATSGLHPSEHADSRPAGPGEESKSHLAPARVACPEGFHWIGQPWASCDECGLPAWEHAGMATANLESPFDDSPLTLQPWKPGEAERIAAAQGVTWAAPIAEGRIDG
jgi:hypothetical protein